MPESCKSEGQAQANGNGMTVYYLVDSIEDAEKRVEELGGKKCIGKTPESDNGWWAKCLDTEGNLFAVYQAKM